MKKLLLLLIISLFSVNAYASDLVLEVKMDDNAGNTTVTEISGYGHTCTLYDANGSPGATTAAHSVPGAPNRGTALSFDGTDDYVDCGSGTSLNITDAITIEAWVKFASIQSWDNIVSKDEGSGNQNKWIFYTTATQIAFHINTPFSGADSVYSNVWSPNTNQWYHLTVTKIGNDYTFYKDGKFLGTDTATVSLPSVNFAVWIGKAEAVTSFNGTIDEVRIHDYALTPAQIQHRYQQGGLKR